MILIRLIASHLLTDFLLQPKKWVADRAARKIRSPYLYLHGLIAGLLAYLFAGVWHEWWIIIAIGGAHTLTDLWKSYQKEKLSIFLIDQGLHFLALLWVWLAVTSQPSPGEWITDIYNRPSFWTLATGYIFVIWPVGYLVAYATKNWKQEIQDDGLYDAGKRIGQLERTLILTFVLIGRYEAIGFLIAAKSVFRFSQIKESRERKVGEYILIGTMLSFAISIFTGLAVGWVNQQLS